MTESDEIRATRAELGRMVNSIEVTLGFILVLWGATFALSLGILIWMAHDPAHRAPVVRQLWPLFLIWLAGLLMFHRSVHLARREVVQAESIVEVARRNAEARARAHQDLQAKADRRRRELSEAGVSG